MLIIDFGLVVLIWIVQIIIYPGLHYYDRQGLLDWHAKYTTRITIIVMPLMIGQIIMHGLGIIEGFSWIKLVSVILILMAWLNTFIWAVSLHGQIANQKNIETAISSLIRVNWYRTVFWTLVFCLDMFSFLEN